MVSGSIGSETPRIVGRKMFSYAEAVQRWRFTAQNVSRKPEKQETERTDEVGKQAAGIEGGKAPPPQMLKTSLVAPKKVSDRNRKGVWVKVE